MKSLQKYSYSRSMFSIHLTTPYYTLLFLDKALLDKNDTARLGEIVYKIWKFHHVKTTYLELNLNFL